MLGIIIRVDLLTLCVCILHKKQCFENSGKPLGENRVQLLAQEACECRAEEILSGVLLSGMLVWM